jgi:hypothetical protein
MGHKSIAEKKEQKKVIKVNRTDEQIIKDIGLNLAAHLSVTPEDVAFLLRKYGVAVIEIKELKEQLDVVTELETEVRKELNNGERETIAPRSQEQEQPIEVVDGQETQPS